ncbi:threonine synthase [archaeon]|nr:MAG: threonine synthase [archaeon]
MMYHSTRTTEDVKSFEDVAMSTYAAKGGLYVPSDIPKLSEDTFQSWKDFSFPQVCANILALFSNIELNELLAITNEAFSLFNDGADPLPLTKVGGTYFLDTSLGPTFAFKDIGQQMLGRILNHILGRKSKRATILVETSGDTGPAAIAGVKGCQNVEIFCLYPHGRVSSVQELQMVTNPDSNVHIYRTDGNTDEQASLLKQIFADQTFVADHNICSVNSINWVRIAAQSSYYVWAYVQMKYHKEMTCDEVDFVIPTGAFGNAMGGYLAKLMGVPIGRIYCATNVNDIVHRTIQTGDMRMSENVPVSTFYPFFFQCLPIYILFFIMCL